MLVRVMVILSLILPVADVLVPHPLPAHVAPFLLVLLGLVYGAVAVDAEAPVTYIVVVIGTSLASSSDVLRHLYVLGPHLDAILDLIATALQASVVTILATRALSRLRYGPLEPPGS